MERATALKKLKSLLGKNLGYRVNDKAPTADERAAARAELPVATAAKQQLQEQKAARIRAILGADAEYQRLHAELAEASKRTEHLFSVSRHYKFTVGVSNSMFFHVKAEGDSWEEIIRKVETEGR